MSTYTALKKRQYLRKEVNTQPKKQLPMVLYKAPRGRSLTNPKTGPTPPELKFVDVAGSIGVVVASQWSELDFLNPINTGTTASQRIGRRLQMKSLLFRWNASTVISNLSLRILIVYDKEPNGLLPLITDVIEADNYNSPMNLSNSNRFVILADEIHDVNTFTPNSNTSMRSGKIFKKLNLPCGFNALSTLDVTSITQGAIFAMCAIPSNAGSAGIGIGYFSRIRYTDV